MEKEMITIRRISGAEIREMTDEVAVEQKIEFVLQNGDRFSMTCTPANMDELILGRRYLLGDLTREEKQAFGLIESSDIKKELNSVWINEIFQIAQDIFEYPGQLFASTGCAHSCALIYKGKCIFLAEDISRHNALDKVIGYALANHISIQECYVFTSGRVSGDYLKKVSDAGFRMVVSRAAVTNCAAALARTENITLLGFVRKNGGNIYWEGAVTIKKEVEIC